MTSQPKTDIPSNFELGEQHITKIRAAIAAAEQDGFEVVFDVDTVYYNGKVEQVDMDLMFGLALVGTIVTKDYT